MNYPILSVVIWLPIAASLMVLAVGDRHAGAARVIALIGAIAGLLVALPLWTQFDRLASGFQFIEFAPWIATFNVNYQLGIDGMSLLLILLNCVTTVLVVIAGWEVIQSRVSQYMAAFLMLSGLMNGVFCALDALLFYVFFEATLIPMFIVIGVWGGPNRVYAAVKFFLYTLAGSLL
ncbi:MAG: proton-conducting transporter membrane subunit, partial [Pseudomonadota bacterium]